MSGTSATSTEGDNKNMGKGKAAKCQHSHRVDLFWPCKSQAFCVWHDRSATRTNILTSQEGSILVAFDMFFKRVIEMKGLPDKSYNTMINDTFQICMYL